MKLLDIFQNRVQIINKSYKNCLLFTLYILDLNREEYKFLSMFLNSEETSKYKNFTSIEHSKRFTICRVFLKFVLASILQKDISSLHFTYGPNGKPYLSDGSIFFNISHSKDLCLIGLSFTNEIGVDIEFIDKNIDYRSLLRLFSSKKEIKWVLERNSIERFYRIWTLKEAILKYTGQGISDVGFPKLVINNKTLLFPDTITYSSIIKENYAISLVSAWYREVVPKN